MRIASYITALLLTIGVFYWMSETSPYKPAIVTHTENNISFETQTIPTFPEKTLLEIPVTITGVSDTGLIYSIRTPKTNQDEFTKLYKYKTTPMKLVDTANGIYQAEISAGFKGKRLLYYFDIRDKTGGTRGKFTQLNERLFELVFIGETSKFISYAHRILCIASFFIVLMMFSMAVFNVNMKSSSISFLYLVAAIFMFIGGIYAGSTLNKDMFDVGWNAIPFGFDVTDNKTQILVLLYLYMYFTIRSSSVLKTDNNDHKQNSSSIPLLIVGSLTLVLYLVPHSIIVDPRIVKYGSYLSIISIVGLYLFGTYSRLSSLKKK